MQKKGLTEELMNYSCLNQRFQKQDGKLVDISKCHLNSFTLPSQTCYLGVQVLKHLEQSLRCWEQSIERGKGKIPYIS